MAWWWLCLYDSGKCVHIDSKILKYCLDQSHIELLSPPETMKTHSHHTTSIQTGQSDRHTVRHKVPTSNCSHYKVQKREIVVERLSSRKPVIDWFCLPVRLYWSHGCFGEKTNNTDSMKSLFMWRTKPFVARVCFFVGWS